MLGQLLKLAGPQHGGGGGALGTALSLLQSMAGPQHGAGAPPAAGAGFFGLPSLDPAAAHDHHREQAAQMSTIEKNPAGSLAPGAERKEQTMFEGVTEAAKNVAFEGASMITGIVAHTPLQVLKMYFKMYHSDNILAKRFVDPIKPTVDSMIMKTAGLTKEKFAELTGPKDPELRKKRPPVDVEDILTESVLNNLNDTVLPTIKKAFTGMDSDTKKLDGTKKAGENKQAKDTAKKKAETISAKKDSKGADATPPSGGVLNTILKPFRLAKNWFMGHWKDASVLKKGGLLVAAYAAIKITWKIAKKIVKWGLSILAAVTGFKFLKGIFGGGAAAGGTKRSLPKELAGELGSGFGEGLLEGNAGEGGISETLDKVGNLRGKAAKHTHKILDWTKGLAHGVGMGGLHDTASGIASTVLGKPGQH